MVTNKTKAMAVVIMGLVGMNLVACQSKNPLNTESIIREFKGKFMFDCPAFPIAKCSKFYAGTGDLSMKKDCEEWTAQQYKNGLNGGQYPTTTTLANFRDPEFWKKVAPI